MNTYKDEIVAKVLTHHKYTEFIAELIEQLNEAATYGLDSITVHYNSTVVLEHLLRWLALNGFSNVTYANSTLNIFFYDKRFSAN